MPFDRPNATELMDAIRLHLDEELRPELSGKAAYDLRIASNLLTILKRELKLGPEAAECAKLRLENLLHMQASLDELNTELSERIRKRELDSKDSNLLAHLRQTTMDRLNIDNPRYSAYIRACGDSMQS